MRYAMPNFPFEFEMPDDWLIEAGAVRWPSSKIGGLRSESIYLDAQGHRNSGRDVSVFTASDSSR
jgi:hypothetical protein